MSTRIQLGDIEAEVIHKAIKHIHLSVYPPTGTVRIAAPQHMALNAVRAFALTKLGWIRKQQRKLCAQQRETPREYLEWESHYLWGQRYLLTMIEREAPPQVELRHSEIALYLRPGSDVAKRSAVLEAWYRQLLKTAMQPLLEKWQKTLGVEAERIIVQRMKTRWGSCTPASKILRLNTELAKKPPECLEYIIVHELMHFLEPSHNRCFVELMDHYLPKWKFYRDELNRLPVRHEAWSY